MGIKIRKDDRVAVIAGKDLGAEGRVLMVLPAKRRVIVEGVNMITRHEKIRMSRGRGGQEGGITHKEAPIDLSNVTLICPSDGPTRVGFDIDKDTGERTRVCRKCGTENLMATAEKTYSPRLKERYNAEIRAQLQEQLGLGNVMQVPRPLKVTVNMGLGDAAKDARLIEGATKDLTIISGQKPSLRRARRSIATFKIREGMPIGVAVTMRGDRMWDFVDRLVSIVLPRIRDFRGLNPQSFDGQGNYSMGLTEQLVFPEVDYDDIDATRGMDLTVVTSAVDNEQGLALLTALGFPFRQQRVEA